MELRLDRYISDMGLASRRETRELLRGGRLLVDGKRATPDAKIDPETAEVTLDGERVRYSRYRYIMLNKPAGVVCAAEDRRETTIMSLLGDRERKQELFSVGRLDKDTEGLLIITNDGDFAHRVISPKSGVFKRYLAEVDGLLTPEDREAMRAGIVLRDGTKCLPAELELLAPSRCIVHVAEGKYHQVKRMLASLGKPVTSLKRLSIGALELDAALAPGEWRDMDAGEAAKAEAVQND